MFSSVTRPRTKQLTFNKSQSESLFQLNHLRQDAYGTTSRQEYRQPMDSQQMTHLEAIANRNKQGSAYNLPSLNARKTREATESMNATVQNASVSTLPSSFKMSSSVKQLIISAAKRNPVQSKVQTTVKGTLRGNRKSQHQPLMAVKSQRSINDLKYNLVDSQKWNEIQQADKEGKALYQLDSSTLNKPSQKDRNMQLVSKSMSLRSSSQINAKNRSLINSFSQNENIMKSIQNITKKNSTESQFKNNQNSQRVIEYENHSKERNNATTTTLNLNNTQKTIHLQIDDDQSKVQKTVSFPKKPQKFLDKFDNGLRKVFFEKILGGKEQEGEASKQLMRAIIYEKMKQQVNLIADDGKYKGFFKKSKSSKLKMAIEFQKATYEQIKDYLELRYTSIMTERIMKMFKFPKKTDVSYVQYIKLIDDFMNQPLMEQKRFAFHILDTNDDGFVCPNDLFHLVSQLRHHDYAISDDIMYITRALQKQNPDQIDNNGFDISDISSNESSDFSRFDESFESVRSSSVEKKKHAEIPKPIYRMMMKCEEYKSSFEENKKLAEFEQQRQKEPIVQQEVKLPTLDQATVRLLIQNQEFL